MRAFALNPCQLMANKKPQTMNLRVFLWNNDNTIARTENQISFWIETTKFRFMLRNPTNMTYCTAHTHLSKKLLKTASRFLILIEPSPQTKTNHERWSSPQLIIIQHKMIKQTGEKCNNKNEYHDSPDKLMVQTHRAFLSTGKSSQYARFKKPPAPSTFLAA